jgi:Kelch motif
MDTRWQRGRARSRLWILALTVVLAGGVLARPGLAKTLSGSWHPVAPMPTSRASLAAATGPDGKIYAIGGCAPGNCVRNTTRSDGVEAYNPSTNTWACSVGDPSSRCSSRRIAPMPIAREGMGAATGRDGKIYVTGASIATAGAFRIGPVATVEAYIPSTYTWACSRGDTAAGCSSRSIAPCPRLAAIWQQYTGQMGISTRSGGSDPNSHRPFSRVEAYTPSTNTWRTVAPLPTARGGLAALGGIHIVGREPNPVSWGVVNTVEAYTPAG